MKKALVLLGLVICLSGCSLYSDAYNHQHMVQNRDNDFLQSQEVSGLATPPGISNSQLGNDYPVPNYNYQVPRQAVSIIPPGSAAAR